MAHALTADPRSPRRARRLTLQREPLTALSPDDLANVAGAAAHTVPDPQCVLTAIGGCNSLVPCPTKPCTS